MYIYIYVCIYIDTCFVVVPLYIYNVIAFRCVALRCVHCLARSPDITPERHVLLNLCLLVSLVFSLVGPMWTIIYIDNRKSIKKIICVNK